MWFVSVVLTGAVHVSTVVSPSIWVSIEAPLLSRKSELFEPSLMVLTETGCESPTVAQF
jgi:hypothetical protein